MKLSGLVRKEDFSFPQNPINVQIWKVALINILSQYSNVSVDLCENSRYISYMSIETDYNFSDPYFCYCMNTSIKKVYLKEQLLSEMK